MDSSLDTSVKLTLNKLPFYTFTKHYNEVTEESIHLPEHSVTYANPFHFRVESKLNIKRPQLSDKELFQLKQIRRNYTQEELSRYYYEVTTLKAKHQTSIVLNGIDRYQLTGQKKYLATFEGVSVSYPNEPTYYMLWIDIDDIDTTLFSSYIHLKQYLISKNIPQHTIYTSSSDKLKIAFIVRRPAECFINFKQQGNNIPNEIANKWIQEFITHYKLELGNCKIDNVNLTRTFIPSLHFWEQLVYQIQNTTEQELFKPSSFIKKTNKHYITTQLDDETINTIQNDIVKICALVTSNIRTTHKKNLVTEVVKILVSLDGFISENNEPKPWQISQQMIINTLIVKGIYKEHEITKQMMVDVFKYLTQSSVCCLIKTATSNGVYANEYILHKNVFDVALKFKQLHPRKAQKIQTTIDIETIQGLTFNDALWITHNLPYEEAYNLLSLSHGFGKTGRLERFNYCRQYLLKDKGVKQ